MEVLTTCDDPCSSSATVFNTVMKEVKVKVEELLNYLEQKTLTVLTMDYNGLFFRKTEMF